MQSSLKRSVPAIITGAALLGSILLAAPAMAAPSATGMMHGRGHMSPGVFGTVASVSGDTITVTAKMWQRPSSGTTTGTPPTTTTTTYTVDATNATVTKDGAASTVSAIATGDVIMVQGTVSGTNVTATTIRDGVKGGMGMGGPMNHGTPPAMIQGNGSPVIGGNVTTISGDTLTVTAKGGTTYTVDGTSATVIKQNATSTLSAIATGDNVIVQGTVNGTSVSASSILDNGTAPAAGSAPKRGGFLGGIFSRIFGFF